MLEEMGRLILKLSVVQEGAAKSHVEHPAPLVCDRQSLVGYQEDWIILGRHILPAGLSVAIREPPLILGWK